jgi:hypothetical protein
VATGILTSPNGKSDDPKDEKDGSSDPQEMHCESSSEEDQDE